MFGYIILNQDTGIFACEPKSYKTLLEAKEACESKYFDDLNWPKATLKLVKRDETIQNGFTIERYTGDNFLVKFEGPIEQITQSRIDNDAKDPFYRVENTLSEHLYDFAALEAK